MHPEVLPKAESRVLRTLAPLACSYQLVLAGGSAAALHLGHRISRDFDFFTSRPFDAQRFLEDVRTLGLNWRLEHEAQASLIAWMEGVKVSAFHYPYPLVEPTVRFRNVAVAGLLDIAAMKFIAIGQKGKKRDFVDLYFILQDVPCSKVGLVLRKRYGRERVNPVHVGKSLVYFQDADVDPDPEYCEGVRTDWPTVKRFFQTHVRQIVLDLEQALED